MFEPCILDMRAMTTTELQNYWIVYAHANTSNTVQFIGISQMADVFKFTEAKNNSEWSKIFPDGTPIKVVFIGMTNDEKSARDIALTNIAHLRPYCNVKGYNISERYQNVKCDQTGEIFASANAAAIAHDLSQSALFNHLKRKKGHKSVKGKTYSYTTERNW